MAEFVYRGEKIIGIDEPTTLENNTGASFDVSVGVGNLADMLCEGMLEGYDRNDPNGKVKFERYIVKRNAIREILGSAMRIVFYPYATPEEKTKDGMICECIWDAIRVARGTSTYGQVLPIGDEPVPKIEEEGDRT